MSKKLSFFIFPILFVIIFLSNRQSVHANVTYYLPFSPSAGPIRVSRTGMLYKPIYDAAGLPTTENSCNTSSYCNGPNGEYHDYGDSFNFARGAIDFSLPYGESVLAAAGGTVDSATNSCQVVIEHADGTKAYYIHASAVFVSPGETVQQGQHIANVGDSCGADGPHLHFALWNGAREIPVQFADVSAQAHGGTIRPSRTGFVEYRYTSDNVPGNGNGNAELSNPSFETGNHLPWNWTGPCNYAVYSGSTAHDGNNYLATNRNNTASCTSFYQDINYVPAAGDVTRFAIWIRSADNNTRTGRVALWATGGQQESQDTHFTVGANWTCVETALSIQNSDHTGLRPEVYLDSLDSVDYYFDEANFALNGSALCNAPPPTPTPSPTPSPTPLPGGAAYEYDVSPSGYTQCVPKDPSNPSPNPGYVKIRLVPRANETFDAEIASCTGNPFGTDGTVRLYIVGSGLYERIPKSYNQGDSTIVYTNLDPYGVHGVENVDVYAYVYTDNDPSGTPKNTEIADASVRFLGEPDLQVAAFYGVRTDTGQTLSSNDAVPQGTSVRLEVNSRNCGTQDVRTDFDLEYTDNGTRVGTDTESTSVYAGCQDTANEDTTITLNTSGNHTLGVCLDTSHDIQESNESNNCGTFNLQVIPPPSADFLAAPQTGYAPLSVSFSNNSTGDVQGWQWEFGDGGTSTQRNPTHVYQQPGSYTVQLTATGPGGNDVIVKQDLIVVSEAPPVADFAATPLQGIAPLTVAFTDFSSGNITSWLWEFGDGQTSSQAHPTHIYTNPGTYTVKLTVNGPGGTDVKTEIDLITVRSPVVTQQIPLAGGWNLTSVPLQAADTSPPQVLSSLSGAYTLARSYNGCDTADPWKTYDPGAPPFANDLTTIDTTTGFWVQMVQADTLVVTGTVPATTTLHLCPGWNLVGFPAAQAVDTATALNSILPSVTLVRTYDASDTADPWKTYDPGAPPFANDLLQIQPGFAYWIQVTQAVDWQVTN